MARRAPAVERSAAILNLLAAHPGKKFTLSEIARDLDINKATLHAILNALMQAGYLVRDHTAKSYGLGAVLIALGNAALGGYPAADAAVPEMHALSEELRLDVVASAAIHDEIVILEYSGTPRPFGVYVQAGQRIPLTPPIGSVFIAWSDPEAIERWIGKLGASVTKDEVASYRKAVEAVRIRGYSVGLEGGSQRDLVDALSGTKKKGERRTLEEGVRAVRTEEYAVTELDPNASYRPNQIGAPVFGPNGEVALGLFLIGFQGAISGSQVEFLASRLRASADRVTKATHGREPE
ncbi:MAG: IclR family transcriptional regulator [Actinomycetota bacterium]|nr:helix-turn-helix domain-containing protein [Actinomycetota bacterium]